MNQPKIPCAACIRMLLSVAVFLILSGSTFSRRSDVTPGNQPVIGVTIVVSDQLSALHINNVPLQHFTNNDQHPGCPILLSRKQTDLQCPSGDNLAAEVLPGPLLAAPFYSEREDSFSRHLHAVNIHSLRSGLSPPVLA